ncbi:phage tail sheath C-terminal domain-containing protein [Paraburkholderia sp. UCT2]|uniref:phage tail sheath C-terminal domain-containing protein n=1 Tax=Paraburkholderia sp. UCT2 TaxID=2615208 RepID=UPI0016554F78|nr:phage tail sheath C-terminal domain-containing protein [Paraburkholderia sp. UCT2]MBC8730272.1 phage tail sheath family protein [Paraburkholderia sp. UCT2]
MPATLTYPGVYIVELQNPMHNITGVATSITAFVGYTATGIDNRAQAIYSFSDFARLFGGLAIDSELSYAVQQFFLNGGTTGYVIRVPHHNATPASVEVTGASAIDLTFTALSSGVWANGQITIDIDYDGIDFSLPGVDPSTFNVTITNLSGNVVETFPQVSLNGTRQNYVANVINDFDTGSQLVKMSEAADPTNPLRKNTPEVSGVLGKRIQRNSGELLFFDKTKTTPQLIDKNYTLTLQVPKPKNSLPDIKDVNVLLKDAPIPVSSAAIASQVQSALANAVALNWNGATLRFIATKSNADDVLRAVASIPTLPDAQVVFSGTAAAPLGLDVTPTNVAHYALGTGNAIEGQKTSVAGTDPGNQLPFSADLVGDPASFKGIYALEKVDLFNLLVIPDATRALAGSPATPDPNVSGADVFPPAIAYCQQRRAFLLVDPPPDATTVTAALDWKTSMAITPPENGACFFPRLRLPDPVNNYQLRTFAPSGVVAGLFARIDGSRGVWKAPAGTEASLTGVQAFSYHNQLTDTENGVLNPIGVNCFRNFPLYGPVLWGSRTLAGADAEASQWKYVPVRRLALFLEESLYRGTKWAVFEPNDEPLWASLRLSIGSFMNGLFRKGAFQGQSPNAAYFVKCDNETTTQNDIDSGVVNVLVGFAPLIPAEFVVIQIQQMAGQVQT